MTYTRRTTLIAQQTSINNQASFPEILSWTGIKKSLPIALLLCVEREKRTTNIRFSIGIDEGHSQLAWEASQLARPARSLKLFGTFLTFFSAIHFFFSFDCFSHFVWTHLLAWFEFAPCCTAGQLQLLSSWLTAPVVDDVPPPTSRFACSFLCWMLHYLGRRNKLKNVWNTFRQLGHIQFSTKLNFKLCPSNTTEAISCGSLAGIAAQAPLMWLGNDLPFIMYFSRCCCIFLKHYDT